MMNPDGHPIECIEDESFEDDSPYGHCNRCGAPLMTEGEGDMFDGLCEECYYGGEEYENQEA